MSEWKFSVSVDKKLKDETVVWRLEAEAGGDSEGLRDWQWAVVEEWPQEKPPSVMELNAAVARWNSYLTTADKLTEELNK